MKIYLRKPTRSPAERRTADHREFFAYVLPAMASLLMFALYAFFDAFFLARGAGSDALAAYNICVPYVNMLFSVSLLLAAGASTVITVFLGAGEERRANEVFSGALLVQAGAAVFIAAASFVGAEDLARFLGATPRILPQAVTYLKALIPFAPFYMLSYHMEIMVKPHGRPLAAPCVVALGILISCSLDYLFIFHLGLKIRGAALAGGISQAVIFPVYLALFRPGPHGGRLRFVRPAISPALVRRFVSNGVPSGSTEMAAGIATLLFNRFLRLHAGNQGLLAYAVVASVNGVVCSLFLGLAQGVQPLFGYYYGRRDERSGRFLLRDAFAAAAALSAAAYAVVTVFTRPLVRVYLVAELEQIVAYAEQALRIYGSSFLLAGINVVTGCYYTALERPGQAWCITLGRGFLFLCVTIPLFSALFGAQGIWYAPLGSEGLALLFVAVFLWRDRQHRRVP